MKRSAMLTPLTSEYRISGIDGGMRMSITAEVALLAAHKRGRVALPLLPGNQHRAERRGVGDRAARHAAEHDRGDDSG